MFVYNAAIHKYLKNFSEIIFMQHTRAADMPCYIYERQFK